MTDLAKLKARILTNPEARAEYEAQAPEFELDLELIAARPCAGLMQAELAQRTLARFAEGTGSRVVVRLERSAL